jgi:hypothetical protein
VLEASAGRLDELPRIPASTKGLPAPTRADRH